MNTDPIYIPFDSSFAYSFNEISICYVCGHELESDELDELNDNKRHVVICPCCLYEFGVNQDGPFLEYHSNWMQEGFPFHGKEENREWTSDRLKR